MLLLCLIFRAEGLRIAPPEAPSTGYMFGKGVYFSDMASKSANYCYTSPGSTQGCLILCDVALGKVQECFAANDSQLAKKYNSRKGKNEGFPISWYIGAPDMAININHH